MEHAGKTGVQERILFLTEQVREAVELAVGKQVLGIGGSLKVTDRDRPTFVTEADKGAEQKIIAGLRDQFPQDGIIGEEYGKCGAPLGGEFSETVDAIDGTHNFLREIKDWVTAVAICRNGMPVGSVIGSSGEFYWPWTANAEGEAVMDNRGAWWRGRLPSSEDPRRWYVVSEMLQLLEDGHGLQRKIWDAAGYHGCPGSAIRTGLMVALGRYDAYINPGVCLWDVAPLVPFAKAAGLVLTRWDGSDPFPNMWNTVMKDPPRYEQGPQCFDMLLAPPHVHAALLPLVQPYANERQIKAYGTAG